MVALCVGSLHHLLSALSKYIIVIGVQKVKRVFEKSLQVLYHIGGINNFVIV